MRGHAASSAWSDLILGRSHKLVGLKPLAACATRAGGDSGPNLGDSGPNFEICDLFHAQSPDTRRGAHARSWRANRDVDVRRLFLGFCLGVHLLALLLDGPYGGEKTPDIDVPVRPPRTGVKTSPSVRGLGVECYGFSKQQQQRLRAPRR